MRSSCGCYIAVISLFRMLNKIPRHVFNILLATFYINYINCQSKVKYSEFH